MPLRNRVDPWGDLHAVAERGSLTGNRGCLIDGRGEIVRHHSGSAWITCVTEFKARRHPLDAPGMWTPLFFLDDAVALAAGHRPCGECRRAEYVEYRDAVGTAAHAAEPLSAKQLHQRLAVERLRAGTGTDRAADRILSSARLADLPRGAVIVHAGHPHLVTDGGIRAFAFAGWGPLVELDSRAVVDVLTPPTSVAALRHGFTPRLHATGLRPSGSGADEDLAGGRS